jgi:hypothetical protein
MMKNTNGMNSDQLFNGYKITNGRHHKGITNYGIKLKNKWKEHLNNHPELWSKYNKETGELKIRCDMEKCKCIKESKFFLIDDSFCETLTTENNLTSFIPGIEYNFYVNKTEYGVIYVVINNNEECCFDEIKFNDRFYAVINPDFKAAFNELATCVNFAMTTENTKKQLEFILEKFGINDNNSH